MVTVVLRPSSFAATPLVMMVGDALEGVSFMLDGTTSSHVHSGMAWRFGIMVFVGMAVGVGSGVGVTVEVVSMETGNGATSFLLRRIGLGFGVHLVSPPPWFCWSFRSMHVGMGSGMGWGLLQGVAPGKSTAHDGVSLK
jgi:hypothetical protein